MALVPRLEPAPDLAHTATLADQGFGAAPGSFTADRLDWLYNRAFSRGTAVMSLFSGDRKVGQVALVEQPLAAGGREQRAAALMDLFILPDFRSRDAIGALYGAAERHCLEEGIDWLLAVPNERAVSINRRLLKLDTAATLDIRVGLRPPASRGKVVLSRPASDLREAEALALLGAYLPCPGTGIAWTPDRLWHRLQDPSTSYGLHATADLLLVSARKSRGRVPFTLLCGFFARAGSPVRPASVRAVTAAACRHHHRPLFVYVGRNAGVPLPGFALPARLRPSLMIIQARHLQDPARALPLDRFECMDFDYA